MSFTCKYTKDNYTHVIELSPSEYEEVTGVRKEISDKKKQLAALLNMYEKLEPSRVYAVPNQIDIDKLFSS